jgi:hypothetical protein
MRRALDEEKGKTVANIGLVAGKAPYRVATHSVMRAKLFTHMVLGNKTVEQGGRNSVRRPRLINTGGRNNCLLCEYRTESEPNT